MLEILDTTKLAECIVCSALVDPREVADGGYEGGCEVETGKWVCSQDCWEVYVWPNFTDEIQP